MIPPSANRSRKPTRTAVVTICCREKNPAAGLLPAIERYRSERISSIYRLARKAGIPFLVLSGRFGLLRPEDPIPYYDYLLPETEVDEISLGIERYLLAERIGRIILFIPDPGLDPKTIPYREAVRRAAVGAAELDIRHIPPFPASL